MQRARRRKPNDGTRILALDPGETTGWAVFEDQSLVACGQLKVGDLNTLFAVVRESRANVVVIESYRVYEHRAQQHIGSEVVTIQYIGILKLAAEQLHLPIVMQAAWQGKQFQTDEKLREWGLYQVAHKHANDAIRHGCYFYLFHK